jgi:F-type H+-transporting ATPase subunit gamma
METLESLGRRIATTEDLRGIVRTMKSLSAVSIRQYEQAVRALRDYRRTIDQGLQVVLRAGPPRRAAVHTDVGDGATLALVFGSDHGLCGRFNQDIARFALSRLDEQGVAPRSRRFVVAGVRAAARLAAADVAVDRTLPLAGAVEGLDETARTLLLEIDAVRAEQSIARVLLFYNRRSPGATARPQAIQLSPMEPRRLAHLESRPWGSRRLPTFTMEPSALLAALVRQHLFISLFRAGAESAASEHATRLATMQAAERNIDDHLDEMNGAYRHRRQALITEELLDVVAGFEALTAAG